jgi:Zn-dependent protease
MEQFVAKISIMLVPALLAVTLHEVAHGYIADRFGDPTARLLGRLTLNPLKHLDPIGTLALIVFKFGWARPVPVNSQNLRNPKKDMIWVALAGPATNLCLAAISALLMRLLLQMQNSSDIGEIRNFIEPLTLMAAFSLYINVILGIFNLLPIPPLDGGRILSAILPDKFSVFFHRLEYFGFVIILFVIFYTPIWPKVLQPLVSLCVHGLAGNDASAVFQMLNFLRI